MVEYKNAFFHLESLHSFQIDGLFEDKQLYCAVILTFPLFLVFLGATRSKWSAGCSRSSWSSCEYHLLCPFHVIFFPREILSHQHNFVKGHNTNETRKWKEDLVQCAPVSIPHVTFLFSKHFQTCVWQIPQYVGSLSNNEMTDQVWNRVKGGRCYVPTNVYCMQLFIFIGGWKTEHLPLNAA